MSTATHMLSDRTKLLDQLWALQEEKGFISDEDVASIAEALDCAQIDIEGVISFYHFFHRSPAGRHTIYLNDSILSEFSGFKEVRTALEKATGAPWNGVDRSGTFGLFETSCIGMSDREPAMLIDFHPYTSLDVSRVSEIIEELRGGVLPSANCDEIDEQVQYTPPPDRTVLFRPFSPGGSLASLEKCTPGEVITQMERAGLRGMGGAFFPVGTKWEVCRRQPQTPKYVVCNADEGEPGTFKDRAILNLMPGLMVEGMIAAGYAIGAEKGIIYLRAEYRWLLPKLEAAVEEYKTRGWLGTRLPGLQPFDFDIEIEVGAGAYVCGEETALLQSLEGRRGEPRNRTYFPVERGFLAKPTIVNNVETFAMAARVLEFGSDYFRKLGTENSPGTRLISVAGDCQYPGIYEIEWGMKLGRLLDLCGAKRPHFIQVSGPSGQCVSAGAEDRRLAIEDLRCGGALTVFNEDRDLLQVLGNYARFFSRESCGICTPCRAGNFIFSRKMDRLARQQASEKDHREIMNWSRIMTLTSRCGLGKTATRSLLSAMEEFPDYFQACFDAQCQGYRPFDLEASLAEYRKIVQPVIHEENSKY